MNFSPMNSCMLNSCLKKINNLQLRMKEEWVKNKKFISQEVGEDILEVDAFH